MKNSLYHAAIAEAKRFLGVAKKLEEECELVDGSRYQTEPFYSPGKHTAALKRASMDLTRALADLRRND